LNPARPRRRRHHAADLRGRCRLAYDPGRGGWICVAAGRAQFPEIAPPQVVVSASYGGASAQTVAETVTTVLEQQINGVQGMSYMSSVSANDGTSTITITFNVGYDSRSAAGSTSLI
jgi:multidrug efflux pump subunit AcrB